MSKINKFMFIPWKKGSLGEYYHNKTDQFADASIKNNLIAKEFSCGSQESIFYLDAKNKPFKKISLEPGMQIHITGHGQIGSPKISPPNISSHYGYPNKLRPDPVDCKVIVQGLIHLGLPKGYSGKIYCNVCYSGLATLDDPPDPPFAKRLAKELWNQGFTAVCVVGYKGPIYFSYENTSSDGQFFKNIRSENLYAVAEEALQSIEELKKLAYEELMSDINKPYLFYPSNQYKILEKETLKTATQHTNAANKGIYGGSYKKDDYSRVVMVNKGTDKTEFFRAKDASISFYSWENK